MKVNLDKRDLVAMVIGFEPYHTLYKDKEVQKFNCGLDGKWLWNPFALHELSKKELYSMYLKVRDSWKKG